MKMQSLHHALAIATLVAALSSCVQPAGSEDSRVFDSSAYSSTPYSTGYNPERRTSYSGYVGSSFGYYDRRYDYPHYHGGYYGVDHDDHRYDGPRRDSGSNAHSDNRKSSSSGSRSRSVHDASPSKDDSRQSRGGSSESRGNSRSTNSSSDDKRQSRGRS